jgi:hypothetical protein
VGNGKTVKGKTGKTETFAGREKFIGAKGKKK